MKIAVSGTGNAVAADADDSLQALHESEQRLQCVIELSADYYWEQDRSFRFTLLRHWQPTALERAPQLFLGKTRWELGGTPINDSWEQHKAMLRARRAFNDFVVHRCDFDGRDRYLSISGQPVFGPSGDFQGYRGIAKDVTCQKRDERLLKLEASVTRLLADADDASETVQRAIRAICESENWDSGHYWHVDPARGVMRTHAGWCIADACIRGIFERARDVEIRPGEGLLGMVWKNGEQFWCEDLSAEPRVMRPDVAQQKGWSAFLFPVIVQSRLLGILDFNGRHIPEPDERLLQLLRVLAAGIGNLQQRAEALDRLRESEERYASTVELAAVGIGHVAQSGRFIHVNQKLCDMLGYSRDELLQLNVRDVSHPDDIAATDEGRARLRNGEISAFKTEKRYIRRDGSSIWVRITVAMKRATDGHPEYDISIVEDISEHKRAEERIRYLATHDEMTGLPNRSMFAQLLAHAIDSGKRNDSRVAVLFIDLDRFKIVNDSLGHEAGDQLLTDMATRIRGCLRDCDVVARLGGDEFVVLAEGVRNQDDAAGIARKILSTAIQPVEIRGHECRVTASIGVSIFPEDADDAQSLMKNADMAMYQAKEEGKNNYQFYTRTASALSVGRLKLESKLQRALERQEFSLHYQPRVNLRSGAICGAEALIRWWNRDLGSVPPAQFIPLAEDSGLIVPLGRWVLQTACAQSIAWQRQGLPPVRVGVNLSLRQFRDPCLLKDISDVLQSTGLDPDLLELEITEGVILHDVERVVSILRSIRDMGVRLAIDDFGTGYSSLAQLKNFPINTLKIDRSFIRDVPHDTEDRAITEAIVAMARTLGVFVVAEGVENEQQELFLRRLGCDEMQGFYFSKPCAPRRFATLLRVGATRIGIADSAR
jgi:diguanylate cyclase (GGDEF)-like protein/PAS domain S-box-containing protein